MYKYLILLLVLFQQCKYEHDASKRAFYYWKTNLELSKVEHQLANELKINKFYLRFFDVDWSSLQKDAVPVAELKDFYSESYPEKIIPCVFITNTVMLKSTSKQLDTLVARVFKKVTNISEAIIDYSTPASYNELGEQNGKPTVEFIPEIQIDCDWTEKSKNNYFYFLKKLKEAFPTKKISVTLRLWQLKYQKKAGVPPADKVMLMCYSTGNPKEYGINNSISSYQDVISYTDGQSYKLPVDVALPIYSWGVLFRNKKFKGIMSNIDMQLVKNDTLNFAHIKDNRYYFKCDTVFGNTYIRYGDELRLEKLAPNDLEKLIKHLKKSKFCDASSTIAFFSWDTNYIKNYGKENIKKYYNSFSGF